ncbi:RNA-directed DNA polymerase, eukaryota, partial [Tanacetum coccineum]
KIFWIRVKEVSGWAPDFSDSNDDLPDSDTESIEIKSKDGFSQKDKEAEEISKAEDNEVKEVEEPGEIKKFCHEGYQSEVEPKYSPGFSPKNSSDTNSHGQDNQVNGSIEKEHGVKVDFKEEASYSVSSGYFEKASIPKTCGSMLQLIEDLIKVGQIMGYKMKGCINNIKEIVKSKGAQEKLKWSRWSFLTSDHVRDSNMFHKENHTISDYFIAIMGKWIPNDNNLLIISVYAPQELLEKKMFWQYLIHVIEGWNGDVIVMGDFNEVRTADERFGSIFNVRGAAAFNSFISIGGLVEVPSGGYSYNWAHKLAAKMSKLDRFLVSKDLMSNCPNISSIILDRYLSDHRLILLRELRLDYGPTPFLFFHHWFELDGFDSYVSKVWKGINVQDSNDMLKLAKKLKILKGLIRSWVKDKKDKASILKNILKKKIADIDSLLDNGEASSLALEDRSNAMNNLINLERMESIELAQKAKIQWSIEGDENSNFFHGIINKKRNNLAIRGITVDGQWIEDPIKVENEFLAHFKERFDSPCRNRLLLDMIFPNKLSTDQSSDLERPFLTKEIKGGVWDCGSNKSPGLDGFTFDFYRKF